MTHIHVDTTNISEVLELVVKWIKYNLFHSWEQNRPYNMDHAKNIEFFEKSNCFSDQRAEEPFMLIDDEPGIIKFGVFHEVGSYIIESGDSIYHNDTWMFIQNNISELKLIALKKGSPKKTPPTEQAFEI